MTSEIHNLAIDARAKAGGEPATRWVLASLSLSMLLSSLGTSIANVSLPALAQAFGAPFQQVQWVVLAYLLAITILIVSVGRLGDIAGRRRLLLAGILTFTIASVLCGAAPTLTLLIAARALQGLGAAIMMALTLAMVGETVPRARAGSAMGLLGTMSAAGTALGPSLGGLLIAHYGWRAVFLVMLPLGLAALVLAYRFLPLDGRRAIGSTARFDHLGTVLLACALGAFALAMTVVRGDFGTLNLVLLALAVLAAGGFAYSQKKAAAPLVPLATFANPHLAGGFAMSVLVTSVMMATLVVGPFYLSGAMGLDAAGVGLAMSCGPIVAAFGGVPSGRLADRFGMHPMIVAGLGIMAAGCTLLFMLSAKLGIASYVGALAILTAGYALFQAANNTAMMSTAASDQRGVVSGLVSLSRNLGLIGGASVMGAVFALRSASTSAALGKQGATAAGMQLTFMVALALILAAVLIAFVCRGRAWRSAGTVG